MAAVGDDGDGGQQQRRTTKAADDDSMQGRAVDYEGEEEGGRQTTTALGQPGRERETNIKKSSLHKKTFFSNKVCPVEVFAPAKNKLLSF